MGGFTYILSGNSLVEIASCCGLKEGVLAKVAQLLFCDNYALQNIK